MNTTKESNNEMPGYDVRRIREDFPILHQQVNGYPLAYLDNGASAQKPTRVITAVAEFYAHDYANVHRGVHSLSQRATDAYEGARRRIQRFIGATEACEVIFVRGTTEAINLVAQSYARPRLKPGDEILLSQMEHHSNIVPWQLVCEQTGAVIRVAPINPAGELDMAAFDALLGPRTRVVAVAHISNVLGTVNPVREIVERAHAQGAVVLLDGAQAVPHTAVDVQALECDFYAFSGHKLYGPSGIGVLWGKADLLETMPPYQGGGDMIRSVSFERTLYNDLPYKFEAGTPHICGAIGLAAAIDYVEGIGLAAIAAHEQRLLAYGSQCLREIPGVRIIGTAADKASILSFVMERVHPHDIATILDQRGIAIRAGHHCAMPLMTFLGLPATARASFALYNTHEEIDRLVGALHEAQEMLA